MLDDGQKDRKLREMNNYYKLKDYINASRIGEDILQKYPSLSEALYIVGLCCAMMEDNVKTVRNFERLVQLDPKYKRTVYLFLSIAYKKLGKLEKGVDALNRAL